MRGGLNGKHHITAQRHQVLAVVHGQGAAIQRRRLGHKHRAGGHLRRVDGRLQQTSPAGAVKVVLRCSPLKRRPREMPHTRTHGASAWACRATLRSSASLLTV